MRLRNVLLISCVVLFCTSLVLGHPKPIQTTSASKVDQEQPQFPEIPATTTKQLNPRDARRPTNSRADALESLERAARRAALKGARTTGDDCTDPLVLTLGQADLPYVTSDTTCGRYNDYDVTCLDYYDGGEDIIYELNLTEDLCLSIYVVGDSWVGLAIDTACPPGNPCLVSATDAGGHPGMQVDLAAGTYYIMIDTWPSPDCTSFTLTIDECCEVTCPGGSTLEGEPVCEDEYQDTYNGGCNSSPAVFSTISCGETVCGQAGTYLFGGNNYRDTDWYEIVITQATELSWTVGAEFPALIAIIDAGSGNCSDYTALVNTTAAPCEKVTLTANVGPGTYWLWVGPAFFDGVPCDGQGSNYAVSVDCDGPGSCDADFNITAPGSGSASTCGAGDDCDLRSTEDHILQVTIPHEGTWVFSLCGSSYDTYMFLGTTCCGAEIEANDDSCGLQSEITADLTAGIYWLTIEGFSGCGDYDLNIYELVGPPNDNCEDATDAGPLADGVPVVLNGDNTGATEDCAALSGGMLSEVWITFTITEPCMDVSIAYCGTTPAFESGYIVLDQSCPCSGSFIFAADYNYTDCGDDNVTIFWEDLGPGTYYWPILTDVGSEGPYTITITGTNCEVCDVECDPSATPEGEPLCTDDYSDAFNGGCNSNPAVFSSITCGETVCGTSGTYLYIGNNYRDTDWYEFELFQPATVTWAVAAEFDVLIFLMEAGTGNCTDYTILGIAIADECDLASLTFDLEPGVYWTWVGPQAFDGVPCGAEYEGTLIVDPPDACTLTGACCFSNCTCEVTTEDECLAQYGEYQGDYTECNEPPPPPPPPCTSPDATITIEILTDSWPEETTWQLVEVGVGVVATGGSYGDSHTTYTTDVPVCSTSCYEFTIYDAFGDGIYSPGGYALYYEGGLVASTMGLGWCCTSETVSDLSPGCFTVEPCVTPDDTVTVELFTDGYGYETSWELIEVGVGVAASGGSYDSNTFYTVDVPVCSTSCYEFIIYDSYGDGMCCAYGNGYYNVYYEGTLVGSGGEFGGSETTTDIGDGCGPVLGVCLIDGTCVMTTDFCCDGCGGTFMGYGTECIELVSKWDSFIKEPRPNHNEGSNPRVRVRGVLRNRSIIGFSLSGIPTTGLLNASLVLTIDDSHPPVGWWPCGGDISAHRLLEPWAQGNGRSAGLPSSEQTLGHGLGVTWNCPADIDISDWYRACSNHPWSGGYYAPATAPDVYHFDYMSGPMVWNVTQDLLDVIGGHPFYGWLLKKEGYAEWWFGKVWYYSREGAAYHGNVNLAPRLLLVYEAGTPMPTRPEPSLFVSSNVADVVVDVNPGEAGTAPFDLSYPAGSVITLTAPASAGGDPLIGWDLNGVLYSEPSLEITLDETSFATALYDVPPEPGGDEIEYCLDAVPSGQDPGVLSVSSNLDDDIWIGLTMIDLCGKGDGTGNFERLFVQGNVVTLIALRWQAGACFMHWKVDGVEQTLGELELEMHVSADVHTIEAVYHQFGDATKISGPLYLMPRE